MKQLFLLTILFFALAACRKADPPNLSKADLNGTWKLVLITGGIGGIHQTADQWGHTETYTFRPDATLTYTIDGKSTDYGTYTLTPDAIYHGDGLSVNGEYMFNIDFTHDTLVIWNVGISDFTTGWYVK